MKNKLNGLYKYYCKIYNANIFLFIGSHKDYQKHLEKKYNLDQEKDEHRQGEFCHLTSDDGFNIYFIWIRRFNWLTSDYSALAHECIHASYSILNNVGIEVSSHNHEALTYLFDSIYSIFIKKLLVRNNNKKKNKQPLKR